MSVNRLGKGLEALIRPEAEQKKKPAKKPTIAKPGVTEIPLKEIRPNPNQPRRDFDESALDELAASIKEKGILTPVTVREVEDGYELVAGERRWRASKKCRKRTIPAYLIAVKDRLDRNDDAPLDYVLPTVKQILLNRRKLELIKQLEKDITKDAIKNKQFELYN